MQLDGYIRVSQVGNRKGKSYISPRVQREDIVRWISSQGAVLGEILAEENQSGGRPDRPELMRAIERIEHGESDGIVIARLSRFGRSLLDGLQMIQRIQKAGGTLASVHEGFDLKTPTGKMVTAVLFAVAEWELDQAREYWDDARRKRTEGGAYIGKGPIGYQTLKSGKLVVDPSSGPVIAEFFKRRAAGARSIELCEFLNASPLQRPSGVPFDSGRVRTIISNPAYKGTVRCGPYERPAAHEALVAPDQWQKCQQKKKQSGRRGQNLLRGRIRCASCGDPMNAIGLKVRQGKNNFYACPGSRNGCSRPACVSGLELDPLLEEFLFEHANSWRSAGSVLRTEQAEAAVAQAERDLASYRDNAALERTIGPDRFEAGAATRVHRLERKLLELAREKDAGERAPLIKTERLESDWPGLRWDERRAAIGQAIDCVVVQRGAAPAIDRTWVYRRNRGPVIEEDGSIDFRRSLPYTNRLYEHRHWGVERIEAELREFFAGRKQVWTIHSAFADAGLGRLHAQVYEWGSPLFWAHRLDLRVPERLVLWNYPRLRGALRPLLKGRDSWPERDAYLALGLGRLYSAIEANGGYQYWAEEFDLPYVVRTTAFAMRRWPRWRIDRELREFLKDRKSFPSEEEFAQAGKSDLFQALSRRLGVTHWAEQFEFLAS